MLLCVGGCGDLGERVIPYGERSLLPSMGKMKMDWSAESHKGLWGVEFAKELIESPCSFKVNNGKRVRFWTDPRCSSVALCRLFPGFFRLTDSKEGRSMII